jgi:hypothetical protein
MMMEAVRNSETSVDNNFTRQYIPEDNSEHPTGLLFIPRRMENHGGIVMSTGEKLQLVQLSGNPTSRDIL